MIASSRLSPAQAAYRSTNFAPTSVQAHHQNSRYLLFLHSSPCTTMSGMPQAILPDCSIECRFWAGIFQRFSSCSVLDRGGSSSSQHGQSNSNTTTVGDKAVRDDVQSFASYLILSSPHFVYNFLHQGVLQEKHALARITPGHTMLASLCTTHRPHTCKTLL